MTEQNTSPAPGTPFAPPAEPAAAAAPARDVENLPDETSPANPLHHDAQPATAAPSPAAAPPATPTPAAAVPPPPAKPSAPPSAAPPPPPAAAPPKIFDQRGVEGKIGNRGVRGVVALPLENETAAEKAARISQHTAENKAAAKA